VIELPTARAVAVRTAFFKILGTLEVSNGDHVSRIAPGRQQIILGTLLLNANRVVSVDQLIDTVWGERSPSTARSQIQICVSALRATLNGMGLVQPIMTRPPGYVVEVAEDSLDLAVFRRLTGEAEVLARDGASAEAVTVLWRALRLWRGQALGGESSPALHGAAVRLEEERLAAWETCLALELQRGRHRDVIGSIGELVQEQPLRERPRGLLMLALHRSGRTAEALATFRDTRRLLVDELGIEPGEELRHLESAILADDTSLHLPVADRNASGQWRPAADPGHAAGRHDDGRGASREPAGPPVPAARRQERMVAPTPARLPQVVTTTATGEAPRQLPAEVADFAGRKPDIARLASLLLGGEAQPTAAGLDDGPRGGDAWAPVVVLTGKAGVGKTVLAVRVGHQVSAAFPDGQLYCSLGGTRAEPVAAADVLDQFLRALGVPGGSVPDGVEARAELYRSVVARRRLLLMLDDAASEAQIMPLLPGAGGSAVLITTRTRLSELPAGHAVDVQIMEPDEALEMLAQALGEERVVAEQAAARALVTLVGGLPLALRIVAARLAARPQWSLASMLGRLADERRRLDELTHGDMMVRASLSLTYDGLPRQPARLLRLLGTTATESTPSWIAGALLSIDPADSAGPLEALVDSQMVDVVGMGQDRRPRYSLHNIIRLFATERLTLSPDTGERAAAVARVVGGWLDLAATAHREVYGGEFAVVQGSASRWSPGDEARGVIAAGPLEWLDAERSNLCHAVGLAADAGLDEHCWQLAVYLVTLFEAFSYVDDWQQTHERALQCVRAAGNRRGEAALLCSLGSLHVSRRMPMARSTLEPALRLFRDVGDAHGVAMVQRNIALLHDGNGESTEAAAAYEESLAGFRGAGDVVGQTYVLTQLAQIDLSAGRTDSAVDRLNEALDTCRDVHSPRIEAQVLFRLGQARSQQRRHDEAEVLMTTVLDMVRRNRDSQGESYALHALGVIYGAMGRGAESEDRLRGAIDVRERLLDAAGAGRARLDLARLMADRGDVVGASESAGRALRAFTDLHLEGWRDKAQAVLASLVR